MKKYSGKTLLILGSNIAAADMVTYARENGAYVLVADYYPVEKSQAKQLADKALFISTADEEQLGKAIEEYHVDGILAGISEFNLLKAMALAEKYGLPFYCTKKQWDMIQCKDGFRALCETYHVPCPNTYYLGNGDPETGWENIAFPAVLKPVDACASAGVHICSNLQELEQYKEDALRNSVNGKIIVEEFAEGNEFTAHYTIHNGKAALASVGHCYNVTVHEGNVTGIQVAHIYPCAYMDEYLKQVDPFMLRLCEGTGVQDGILFVQGIYNETKNRFYIFEAGLRSGGESPYRIIRKVNGVNALQLLIDHALGVASDYSLEAEDPFMHGKYCGVVSFVAKGATVGSINGLEEAVAATPSVIDYERRYPVGSTTPDGDTIRQVILRFVMICDNREQMARDVEYLNTHITVLSDKGEDMVIKFDPQRLENGK